MQKQNKYKKLFALKENLHNFELNCMPNSFM